MMKHGGQQRVLAKVFGIKAQKIEASVTNLLFNITECCYQYFIVDTGAFSTIKRLREGQQLFKNFPEAHHATDVTC